MPELPEFVPPMLARLEREPFDSEEHLFEVKWDGIRAQASVPGGTGRAAPPYRLLSRNRRDLAPRYPELAFLGGLPPGLMLDGELVALKDGRPDFYHLMQRERTRNEHRIAALTREIPVSFVVFDVLYAEHVPVLERPLTERRALLAELVSAAGDPRLLFSEGVEGSGELFFDEVRRRGLEGMVAKRLRSPYQPGRRTGAWAKVKPRRELLCAILGYLAEGDDVRSLVIGAEEEGRLACVGRVGSGLTDAMRARLLALFRGRPRAEALIDCATALADSPGDVSWIEPGLFCKVEYLERTEHGLRAPVFVELIQGEG